MADTSYEALLLQRYGQIEQRLQSYDRTIHNSFYLSLVYLGALMATITPLPASPGITRVVLVFSAFVFVGLWLWNEQAMEDRAKSNERKATVERILTNEARFVTASHTWGSVLGDQHHSRDVLDSAKDSSSVGRTTSRLADKDHLVLLYYLGMAAILLVAAVLYPAVRVISPLA